jgi:hypothetical protein
MHERTTNPPRDKGPKEIHPAAKAPNSQGIGSHGEWHRSGPKAPDPSPNPLSLEEGFGAGSPGVPERQEATHRSPDSTPGEGKPEVEGGLGPSGPGVYAFKRRDEFGLTHRSKGTSYSLEQRQRIIAEVQKLVEAGISKVQALRSLGICRSTDYGWVQSQETQRGHFFSPAIDPGGKGGGGEEKEARATAKPSANQWFFTLDGVLDSPFELLSDPQAPWGGFPLSPLREAPWKVPRYEPFRPNPIWGEDWTLLGIGSIRHYLLTLIDYFSRYIVAWGVVKTVTRREVQNLVALAYLSEGIGPEGPKPSVEGGSGISQHGP